MSPNERETLQLLVQNLRSAESCMRSLATLRSDMRWLGLANLMGNMKDKVINVGYGKSAGRIITPH